MSRRTEHIQDLFDLAKILARQSDFQEILRLTAQKAAQFHKADLTLILMLNPDTRKTVRTIIKDGKHIEQKEYRNINIHVGGWIINNQKPFISAVIQKDERFAGGLFDKVPVKTVAGVPLIIESVIIGALMLLYRDISELIDTNLIKSLENLAALSAPYLYNAQKIREYFTSDWPETSLLLKYTAAGLYGKSQRFIELLHGVEAAARCDARVLLIGETGTGKELIARAIHQYSSRSGNPFVAVDCGAIAHNLLESEFFGHTRGAFTGAHSERQGLFQQADKGSLFMDEVNNLTQEMQVKLLRVLQEGEIRPVGGEKTIKTDVRVIAASSGSLKKLVEDKLFREDLFFRLHVYPIYIPNLTERQDDIPLLANHFLIHFARQQNKEIQFFHDRVIDFIKHHAWIGNIRELENFVERLVTLAPAGCTTIGLELFPEDLQEALKNYSDRRKQRAFARSLKGEVQDFEAELIKKTLVDCRWNRSEAARRLNTSEKNIRYKMEKLGIRKPE